jgi:hypothetical protein
MAVDEGVPTRPTLVIVQDNYINWIMSGVDTACAKSLELNADGVWQLSGRMNGGSKKMACEE